MMYKYTVRSDLIKHQKKIFRNSRWPAWEWYRSEIEQKYLHGRYRTYQHHQAFRDIGNFCFYSKKKLFEINMNGYLFPCILFDEVVI